jgi:hypothetical protein
MVGGGETEDKGRDKEQKGRKERERKAMEFIDNMTYLQ